MRFLRHPRNIVSIAYAADGKTLFSGDGTGTLRAWNLATGEQSIIFSTVLQPKELVQQTIGPLEASPDGRRLAVWWGRLVICRTGPIPAPDHKPSERFVLTNEPQLLVAPGWTIALYLDRWPHLEFSPDWTFVAETGPVDRGVHLRKTDTGDSLGTLGPGLGLTNFFPAFSADGKTLAAFAFGIGNEPHRIVLWDVEGRRQRGQTVPGDRPLYSPDGRWLAVSNAEKIELYDARSEHLLCEATIRHPTRKHIQQMVFSPDGKWLLTSARDKVLRLWDVASQKVLQEWAWQIGEVSSIKFSPDGMTAAAAGTSRKVVVWDLDL
jgi:WD40 repeat protein